MVFSGAIVQYMERRYQALVPDLSGTGRDYQEKDGGLVRHMEKIFSHTRNGFPKSYTLNLNKRAHVNAVILRVFLIMHVHLFDKSCACL